MLGLEGFVFLHDYAHKLCISGNLETRRNTDLLESRPVVMHTFGHFGF